MPFHFHVQKEDWAHISWLSFFEDFSQDSDCPIVLALELNDTVSALMSRHKKWEGLEKDPRYPFLIQGQNVIVINGMKGLVGENKHFFVRPFGENFNELLSTSYHMASNVFGEKSLMAKAIWNPRRDIRVLVQFIVRDILEGKPFLAVHIRKGDKIRLEASDIPVERYVSIASDLCQKNGLDRIFAFSDDEASLENFRRQMETNPSTKVFTLNKITELVPASVVNIQEYTTQGVKGYEHWEYPKLPR